MLSERSVAMSAAVTTVTVDDVKERTRAFLFRFVRTRALLDTDDFFSSGMLTSLFAMQLVMFVEREFGIKVANQDLDLKNFRTVQAIADFVGSKRSA
jgi:methoxymalonate biosynthesis acyl carrier protein